MGIQYNRKHGFSGNDVEKLYKVWTSMKCRCFNKRDKSYMNYGGRGITVCPPWRVDYGIFRTWCLKNGYKETLTLDRVDNNGGYTPDNCRFVDRKTQNNNKRQTWTFLEIGRQRKPIVEWSKDSGVDQKLISCRLSRGWSAKRAVFQLPTNPGG